jgi:hypothetical protein
LPFFQKKVFLHPANKILSAGRYGGFPAFGRTTTMRFPQTRAARGRVKLFGFYRACPRRQRT